MQEQRGISEHYMLRHGIEHRNNPFVPRKKQRKELGERVERSG